MKLTENIPTIVCIYKITNEINHLIIIGSTTNLKNRINHYRNDVKKLNPLKYYNVRFYNDLIKYGINNFNVEILEEIDSNITNKELKNKETKYILKYNSINPKIGYNLRLDVNDKYICNNSTKLIKKLQTKQQWLEGIRDTHSDTMKNYWKDNTKRREQQSKIMTNNLSKYLYNVYNINKVKIYSLLTYKQLKDIGCGVAIRKFSIFTNNKRVNNQFAKPVTIVTYKDVYVERIKDDK